MKQKNIYYNKKGEIDKFATYINNNNWCLPVIFIISVLLLSLNFIKCDKKTECIPEFTDEQIKIICIEEGLL